MQISRESRDPAALLFVFFFCILLVFLSSLETVVEFQFPSRFCNGALELRFPWRFLSSCVLVFRMDAVDGGTAKPAQLGAGASSFQSGLVCYFITPSLSLQCR